MVSRLRQTLKQAVQELTSQRFLSFTGIFTLTLGLLIATLIAVTLVSLESSAQRYARALHTTIFIDTTAGEDEITELIELVESWPEVASVRRISAEQALGELTELLEGGDLSSGALSTDLLPASLEVTLHDPLADMTEHRAHLAGVASSPAVLDIATGHRSLDSLKEGILLFEVVGGTLAALLLLAGVFLVSHIFTLSLERRADALKLYSLLGADPRTLRWPLYTEGILMGLVAGLLATGLLTGIMLPATPYFADSGFFDWVVLERLLYPFLPAAVGAGVLAGIIGVFVALRLFDWRANV